MIDYDELKNQLIQSTDQDELDRLVQIFNLNLKKKELLRSNVLSNLQDNLTEQIEKRIQNNSDCFSNKDLLDYLRTIQSILDKQDNLQNVKVPTIAVQQNTINIGDNQLDKDSRDRIKNAIQHILNQQNTNIIDVNSEE